MNAVKNLGMIPFQMNLPEPDTETPRLKKRDLKELTGRKQRRRGGRKYR